MTPAHTNTPLRRSGISKGADETIAANVTINDDDAERQESRRRTLLNTSTSLADSTATLEDNETLKKCLEFYNGNKLSKENAWSMSLIDTLSRLLDRHHKSLSNFKVAGSSLEASSKVYGLRVDSIHNDVLRLSAGLNAKKFAGRNLDEDDDDDESNQAEQAEGGNVGADAASQEGAAQENAAPKAKPKRQRKPKSTITKNKETINGKLDTVPLQDPIFGKLNTIVGSINSSTRLMNNILPTADSELRLRTTFSFWDKSDFPTGSNPSEKFNFFAAVPENAKAFTHLMPCDRLFRVENLENLQLRSLHTGYIISDTPDPITDDKDSRRMSLDSIGGNDFDDGGLLSSQAQPDAPDVFHNSKELSMAFDMNAECEPMPMLDEQAPILNVDFNEMEEITQEERMAINNCKGLRKQAVVIEDLRPVDATSNLEYSYRPIDKISQFWAGPSHWKFKATRARITTFGTQQQEGNNPRSAPKQRGRSRNALALQGKKGKQINFGEVHDNLFIKLDEKYKSRKVNIQKKWDQRKLKLPTDMCIDPNMFLKYKLAPGLVKPMPNHVGRMTDMDSQSVITATDDLQTEAPISMDGDDHHFGDNDFGDDEFLNPSSRGDANNMDISSMSAQALEGVQSMDMMGAADEPVGNDTVLEIGTHFEGAPSQVTKIIVPFAKRAKVIDMKQLKRTCSALLTKQLRVPVPKEEIPQHPIPKNETYSDGVGSFNDVYIHLPELLTKQMTESLSTSIAFYSVLHLANEFNLRLIQQADLKDFKIRQVLDGNEHHRKSQLVQQK